MFFNPWLLVPPKPISEMTHADWEAAYQAAIDDRFAEAMYDTCSDSEQLTSHREWQDQMVAELLKKYHGAALAPANAVDDQNPHT